MFRFAILAAACTSRPCCGSTCSICAENEASLCVSNREALAMEEVAQACIRALMLTGVQSAGNAAEPAAALFPAARTLRWATVASTGPLPVFQPLRALPNKRFCDACCPACLPCRVALRVNAGTLVACGNVLAVLPGGLCLLPAAGSVAGSAISFSGPCCAPPGLQLARYGCLEVLSDAAETLAQQHEATLAVPIMEAASAAGAIVLTADRRCSHLG